MVSLKQAAVLGFHFLGSALFVSTYAAHKKYVFPISSQADFAGSYKFLTFLNLVSFAAAAAAAAAVFLASLLSICVLGKQTYLVDKFYHLKSTDKIIIRCCQAITGVKSCFVKLLSLK